jgi:hypothetical protein
VWHFLNWILFHFRYGLTPRIRVCSWTLYRSLFNHVRDICWISLTCVFSNTNVRTLNLTKLRSVQWICVIKWGAMGEPRDRHVEREKGRHQPLVSTAIRHRFHIHGKSHERFWREQKYSSSLFLTSVLDGDWWSNSSPAVSGRTPDSHWNGGWVAPELAWLFGEEKNPLLLPVIELRFVQSIADCAIPTNVSYRHFCVEYC